MNKTTFTYPMMVDIEYLDKTISMIVKNEKEFKRAIATAAMLRRDINCEIKITARETIVNNQSTKNKTTKYNNMYNVNHKEDRATGMVAASHESATMEAANGIINYKAQVDNDLDLDDWGQCNDIYCAAQNQIDELDDHYGGICDRYDKDTAEYWAIRRYWATEVNRIVSAMLESIGEITGCDMVPDDGWDPSSLLTDREPCGNLLDEIICESLENAAYYPNLEEIAEYSR